MLSLERLKENIEKKLPLEPFYIFCYEDNTFIVNQYIRVMSQNRELKITYVDDLKGFFPDKDDIFGTIELIDENCLYIYKCDEFDSKDFSLKDVKNLIIICKKLDQESEKIFDSYIVKFPKLEDWQIKDYVYSKGEGISDFKLDWLCSVAGNDIYRLDSELSKLMLFSKSERDQLFEMFANEDMYSDMSSHHTFDMSSAILKRDVKRIAELLTDKDKWDSDPLPLQVLLSKNFKQVIQIQSSPSITADKLGMKPNQFYAVSKNNCGHYSKDQLLKIFDIVNKSEFMMKTGQLPLSLFLDYMIINILSV